MFDKNGNIDINKARNHQKTIPGRSDKGITDLYLEVLGEVPNGETIVEVGSLYGSSLFWLVMNALNIKKSLDIVAVDHFKGSVGPNDFLHTHKDIREGRQKEVFDKFMKPLEGYYRAIEGDSSESAYLFNDKSVYFVFIDAEHTYEAVKRDMLAWLPKLKSGGLLTGHDFNLEKFPGVRRAVEEVCEEKGLSYRVRGPVGKNKYPCWEIRIP